MRLFMDGFVELKLPCGSWCTALVIIFPNPLPILNRDVVPYTGPDDSLVFGHSFFRCERLTDLVKLSDVPLCIPTSRKL